MYGESRLIALPRLVARNRRRYGGYIVHVGVVVIFAAFAGMAFKREFDLTLNAGEIKAATDAWGHRWTFLSQGISRYKVLNREVTAIALDVTRDGKPMGVITSEKRQHVDSRGAPTFEPSTEVGIQGSFKQDVYVVLAGVRGARCGRDSCELQSARPLGLARRRSHGDRRAGRDVAAGGQAPRAERLRRGAQAAARARACSRSGGCLMIYRPSADSGRDR